MKYNCFKYKQSMTGAIFIAPSLLVLTIFLGYPVYKAFFISLTKYDIVNPPKWVGLYNYKTIISNNMFWNSLEVTLKFVIGTSVPLLILALLLAIKMNSNFKGSHIAKAMFFAPYVISEAIAAVVWLFILNPYGVLNEGLMKIGIIKNYIKWLMDPKYVIIALVIYSIWKNLGYFMIVFLTGLQNIPRECYEAAAIDGCVGWKSLIYITMPLLKPTLLFASIIVLINTLNTFTPFYLMTRGGPNNSSQVLSLLIYDNAFKYMEMGKASAICIIMLLFVAILSIGLFYFGRND